MRLWFKPERLNSHVHLVKTLHELRNLRCLAYATSSVFAIDGVTTSGGALNAALVKEVWVTFDDLRVLLQVPHHLDKTRTKVGQMEL